jgi:hypothetical protein
MGHCPNIFSPSLHLVLFSFRDNDAFPTLETAGGLVLWDFIQLALTGCSTALSFKLKKLAWEEQ